MAPFSTTKPGGLGIGLVLPPSCRTAGPRAAAKRGCRGKAPRLRQNTSPAKADPELGFGVAQAAELPLVGDEVIDEHALLGAVGLVALVVFGGESLEVIGYSGLLAKSDRRYTMTRGWNH